MKIKADARPVRGTQLQTVFIEREVGKRAALRPDRVY